MGAVPTRRCLVCRRSERKDALVRLVVADSAVVVDPSARASGRGAYLCEQVECLDAALRRDGRAILRALRQQRGDVTIVPAAVHAGWEQARDGNQIIHSGKSPMGVSA